MNNKSNVLENDFSTKMSDLSKVKKVIYSCKTEEHLESARMMIELFYAKYKDSYYYSYLIGYIDASKQK